MMWYVLTDGFSKNRKRLVIRQVFIGYLQLKTDARFSVRIFSAYKMLMGVNAALDA